MAELMKMIEGDPDNGCVVVLRLRERSGRALPPWTPGAHIDLVLGDAPTRQYSLCGNPAARHEYRIGVLRDPNGSGGSRYVHDTLAVGQVLEVRGPRNHFRLLDSPKYVFIAGGIGITPILTMIDAVESAGREWQLVYGGRQRASMAFLHELARYGGKVRIEPLLNAVELGCQAWPQGSLRLERFAPKSLTEPVRADAFEVVLARSDLTLTIPSERSILEVVEEAGVAVLSSCAEGTCVTCETAVVDGIPDHRDSVLNEDERGPTPA